MNMQALRIFTTGGTIDKIYFDARSEYEVGEPQIGDILREMNVQLRFAITPLMRKDSLDMNNIDRARIRSAVAAAAEDRIVITHGTDTMT
ncbi:MAG: asparaginase, partial [Gammaproteobacteria bacterium]|nr:asparaginase [Gammaproteobacteria bacterium]